MNYYIIGAIIIAYLIFIIFLYLLKNKIDKFEDKIIKEFKEKNNLIPSIYEATKNHLNKHDQVFKEAIKLKKKDFSENSKHKSIAEKVNTYKLIHNELNFIFRISNKNQKLLNHPKFLFIKDLIIERSEKLGNDMKIYKDITIKFNKMIFIKNITIIGLFFPIRKKEII